jgi:5-oxoprolinase (ATP-hydrolysing)
MHAWKYPVHELQLAVLAEQTGFTQISVSHQVSSFIKIVSHGDTTVVDAYLSLCCCYRADYSSGWSG